LRKRALSHKPRCGGEKKTRLEIAPWEAESRAKRVQRPEDRARRVTITEVSKTRKWDLRELIVLFIGLEFVHQIIERII
jgi:hypothetical protein